MLTKRIINFGRSKTKFKKLYNFFSNQLSKDPWIILGVDKNANEKDVKKAYVSLVKKYHPDVVKDNGEKFKEIQKAYEIMTDPTKLRDYEMKNNLHNQGNQRNNQDPFSRGSNPYDVNFNQRQQYQGNGYKTTYYYSDNSNPGQRFYYTYTTNNSNNRKRGGKSFEDVMRDAFYQQQRRQQNFYSDGPGFNDYSNSSRKMSEEERRKYEEQLRKAEEELLNFLRFGTFGRSRSSQNKSTNDKEDFNRYNSNNDFRAHFYRMGETPHGYGYEYEDHFSNNKRIQYGIFLQFFFYMFLFFLFLSLFRPRTDDYYDVGGRRMSPEEAFIESQRRYNERYSQKKRGQEQREYVLVKDLFTGEVFETTAEEFQKMKQREYSRYNYHGSGQTR